MKPFSISLRAIIEMKVEEEQGRKLKNPLK